jgi:hypothetical protein
MSKKSKAELEVENRYLRSALRSDRVAIVLSHAIRHGGVVAVFYFIFRSIEALAGKETIAVTIASVIGKAEINNWLAWVLAISFGYYGRRQKQLRRKVTERLQERIKSLENKLDKNRSSSNLTPGGETRLEDRP